MNESLKFWGSYEFSSGQLRSFEIGPLGFCLKRDPDEWELAIVREDGDAADLRVAGVAELPPREDAEWKRLAGFPGTDSVRIVPCLPDRPVIVRPEMPIEIFPGAELQFFFGVPAFVSIVVLPGGEELAEFPSSILSNSWSGATTEGELCYGLRTRAKRRHENLLAHPHRIVCPVTVRNRHDENLKFERLSLPLGISRVYRGASRLWADGAEVSYFGPERASKVERMKKAPEHDGPLEMLCEAREKPSRKSLLSSFANLSRWSF